MRGQVGRATNLRQVIEEEDGRTGQRGDVSGERLIENITREYVQQESTREHGTGRREATQPALHVAGGMGPQRGEREERHRGQRGVEKGEGEGEKGERAQRGGEAAQRRKLADSEGALSTNTRHTSHCCACSWGDAMKRPVEAQ